MAGRKTFVNNSKKDLSVTLYVRKGANPGDGNAGESVRASERAAA